ncbi:MAG: ROK family protein [Patescibacteria group bacterium]
MPKEKVRLSLTIGGTHVLVMGFNKALQSCTPPFRCDLDAEAPRAETVNKIIEILKQAFAACQKANQEVIGIGVGAPGPINMKTGKILETPNIKGLRNVELQKILEKEFSVPVKVNNDANVQGLGELTDEPPDCQDLILVTLGSGTGVAYIKDRRIVDGRHCMACEMAKANLNPPNGFGVEQICSINGVIGLYFLFRGTAEKLDGDISPKKIALLAFAGYQPAILAYQYLGRQLGTFLAILINTVDPDSVVISGGIAEAEELFIGEMFAVIKANINPEVYNGIDGVAKPLMIRKSRLGEDAQAIGAAMLIEM